MDATQFMSVDWLQKVCRTPENDVRAHQIALTYFHLAKHLDHLVHEHSPAPRPTNANWFNFGLWGTLSVSQNIGGSRPLQRLNSGAAMPLRRLVTPTVLNVKASRRQEVARALSWAQLLIFVSSCTALRLFDKNRDADEPFSGGQLLEGFTALGVSGAQSDPFGVSEERHASNVAKAFRLYSRARRAMTPSGDHDPIDRAALGKARAVQAQFVLGANVLLTEIEQDIADPAVSVVLDLVPRRLGEAMDWRLAKLAQRFRGIPTHYSSLVLPFLHADERRAVDAVWSRFMTDQVLVMALPTETLRVGRDIPPRRRDAPYFPADLLFPANLHDLAQRYWQCPHIGPVRTGKGKAKAVDTPVRCPACESGFRDHLDVAERVRSLDRTVGDGRGSAARDWRRWDERMNWALTMMRSRQHDETLFWRPYSTRDESRIVARDLPLRSGDASAHQVQAPAFEFGPIDVNLTHRSDR